MVTIMLNVSQKKQCVGLKGLRNAGLLVIASGFIALSAAPLDMIEPSSGFHFGDLTVSPFAEVLYFYDTNYDRTPDNEHATHGPSLRGGADLSYAGNQHSLVGQFWYQWENYIGDSYLDNNQWRETVRYMYETPQGTRLHADQYYGQTYQSDLVNGQWRDRREFMVGAGVAHSFSPKTKVQFDVRVEDIDYENQALYDWREYSFDAALARRFGNKSDIFVTAGTSLQESDSYSGYSKSYRLGAGLASRATEKIRYSVAAGAEAFDYNGMPGSSVSWAPYYQLGATWQTSRKWTLDVTGQGKHSDSEEVANNFNLTYTLGVGATYKPNRRISVAMRSLWRYDDSEYGVLDPASGNIKDKTDHEFGLRADVSYRLNKYASLRLGGEATKQISTIDSAEYDRFRVDMGLCFRY